MTQPSVDNQTNYTRILKNDEFIFNEITDGTATISATTISDVAYPVNNSDIATRQYVLDQSSINIISPIANSIQYNDGADGFASSANLTWSGTTPALSITDTFVVNDVTLNGQTITNFSNFYTSSSAVNKGYVPVITTSSLSNSANNTQLGFSHIYNNILYRTSTATSGIVQDVLPASEDILDELNSLLVYPTTGYTFDFSYRFVGTGASILLFSSTGNTFEPKGNFLNYYGAVDCLTVPINTTVDFKCITGSTNVTFCITNLQTIYANNEQQLTNIGLRTNNFFSTSTGTKSAFIIYPLDKLDVESDSVYQYTFSELKQMLITRNMNNDVSDTFEDASIIVANDDFGLGYGSSKLVIQNISDYTLTLNVTGSTGWTCSPASNPTIETGKNGLFYINYDSTCTLFTVGIFDRNG
jgi:hypothetical protein